MPSSAVRSFTDPDDCAAAIRAAQVEMTVTGCGDYAARQIRIDLHRLWMQQISDSLPRILHAACAPGRAIITFDAQPGADVVMNGVTIPPGAIIRHSEAHDFYQRSSAATVSASMSLSIEDLASVGKAISGYDLTLPNDARVITPAPSAMLRLRDLHATAGQLAIEAPEVLANPEVARGLEQELIQAMVACFGTSDV